MDRGTGRRRSERGLWFLGSGLRDTRVATDAQEMRLQIVTPAGASLVGFAVSPDRRALVYQATTEGRTQLWIRPLDSDTARPLDGTEGAFRPFWAPDSRSIGFFTADQVKRIDLDGGLVRTLASAPQSRGGTWGSSGTILFAAGSAGSLNAVPAGGGDAVAVTRVDRPRQTGHRFPHFLPDGRHFLFYSLGAPEGRGVYLGTLGSIDAQRLFDSDSAAVFAAPDRVLFAREGALWAQRLDLTTLRPVGEPVPVSTQVAVVADLFGDVALSETAPGLIAYRAGAGKRQFRWLDRTGRQVGAIGGPDEGQPAGPKLSPDGRTVLFRRTLSGNTDLWSIETSRNVLRKLTSHAAREYDALSSPGGDRMMFSSDRAGVLNFYETSLSAAAHRPRPCCSKPPSTRTQATGRRMGDSFSTRSKVPRPETTSGCCRSSAIESPRRWRRRPPRNVAAASPPIGRWVAYESNESGRIEIYVQSFPDLSPRRQISTGGGTAPVWRGDGRELFFRSPEDQLMVAQVVSSATRIDIGHAVRVVRLATRPSP